MTLLETIETGDRLISLQQALILRDMGIIQLSHYGYGRDGALLYEPGDPFKIFDWSKDSPSSGAAFSDSDLLIMLYTLGYYTCGRTYLVEGSEDTAESEFTWWADSVTHVCELTGESHHAVYGRTAAEAMGNLIIKLIKDGVPDINWVMYHPDRMKKIIGPSARKPSQY